MNKSQVIKILIRLSTVLFTCHAFGQQVSTSYFMENVPTRHILNPAFQPLDYFYLSVPILGFSQFNVGNNSIVLKDIVNKENGALFSLLNSDNGVANLFDALKSTSLLQANLQTSLISMGIRHKNSFWSFSLTEKIEGKVSIPKNIANLVFYFKPSLLNSLFDISSLQTEFTSYSEAAFGYSERLSDQWSVGIKMKYLYGRANFSIDNKSLKTDIANEKWNFNIEGVVNMSSPSNVKIGDKFKSITIDNPLTVNEWLKPSGAGIGVDLGADFRATKNINLYASITDLGYIRWKKNSLNVDYSFKKSFSNDNYSINSDQLFVNKSLYDTLVTTISNSKVTNNNYSTATTAKLNLGAEYTLPNNYLSFGLLSITQTFRKIISEEITLSINAKPNKWLNTTVSYSIFNGSSTFGAGIGLLTGYVHWFLAADYIPFNTSSLRLSDFGYKNPSINFAIPDKSKSYNFCGGMTFVFDEPKRKTGLINKKNKNTGKKEFFQSRSRNTFHQGWESPQTGLIR